MARDPLREAPGLSLLRPTSSATQDSARKDLEGALKASDGEAKGQGLPAQELSFLEELRKILADRPVITPIPGEESAEIKASSAILLRYHEGGWQVLLVKRAKKAPHKEEEPRYEGYWVFPSEMRRGHSVGERKERPFEAILRGLQEELNFSLRSEDILGRLGKFLTGDKKAIVSPILFFVPHGISEKLQLNYENERAVWAPVSLFLEGEIRQEGFLPEGTFGEDALFGPAKVAIDFAEVVLEAQARSARDGGGKAHVSEVLAIGEDYFEFGEGLGVRLVRVDGDTAELRFRVPGDVIIESRRDYLAKMESGSWAAGTLAQSDRVEKPYLFLRGNEVVIDEGKWWLTVNWIGRTHPIVSLDIFKGEPRGRKVKDLNRMLFAMAHRYEQMVTVKEKTLWLEAPEEPIYISSSARRGWESVEDAISDLIDHALMHTDRGGRVHISLEKSEYQAVINIQHTGEGRGDSVSKERRSFLVGMRGAIKGYYPSGTLEVYSKGENQGETFVLTLPLARIQQATQTEPDRTKDGGAKLEPWQWRAYLALSHLIGRRPITVRDYQIEVKRLGFGPVTQQTAQEDLTRAMQEAGAIGLSRSGRTRDDLPQKKRSFDFPPLARETFWDRLPEEFRGWFGRPFPSAEPQDVAWEDVAWEDVAWEVKVGERIQLLRFAKSHGIPEADFKKGIKDPYVLYHLAAALRLHDDSLLKEDVANLLFHRFLYPAWTGEALSQKIGWDISTMHHHLHGREGTSSPYTEFVAYLKEKDPPFLSALIGEGEPRFSREILETTIQSTELRDADRRLIGEGIDIFLKDNTVRPQDRNKLLTLKVYLGLETDFSSLGFQMGPVPRTPKRRSLDEVAEIFSRHLQAPLTIPGVELRLWGHISLRPGRTPRIGAFDLLAGWFDSEGNESYARLYPRFIDETRRKLFREKIERKEGEADRLSFEQRKRLQEIWSLFRQEVEDDPEQTFHRVDAKTQKILHYRMEGKSAGDIASLLGLTSKGVIGATSEHPRPPIQSALELVEKRIEKDQLPKVSAEGYWRERLLAGRQMPWKFILLDAPEVPAIWVEFLSRQTERPWEKLRAEEEYKETRVRFPNDKRERMLASLYQHFHRLKMKDPDDDRRRLTTPLYIIKVLAPYRAQAEVAVRKMTEEMAADGGSKVLYQEAVQALREAEKTKEEGLEKYDEALLAFARFLEENDDRRYFLVGPFIRWREDEFWGGERLPILPDFTFALERLIQNAVIGLKSEIRREDREEILSLLVASTQLWPVTKSRRKPTGTEAKTLTFKGRQDKDGKDVLLTGYFFETKDTSQTRYPTVIMLAPFGQSVLVLQDYVHFLQENYHMNVLLLEMRHHGESGGEFSSLGHLEKLDLPLVIEQLTENEGLRVDPEGIIGYGFSLGTYVWMMAEKEGLVKPRPKVLDTFPLFDKNQEGTVDWGLGWEAFSFGLPRELTEKTIRMHQTILRHHLHQEGLPLSEDKIYLDAHDLIRHVKSPTLVVIPEKDAFISPKEKARQRAEKTSRIVEAVRQRLEPEGILIQQARVQGGHARSFVEDPAAYKTAVRDFLDKVIPKVFYRQDRPERFNRPDTYARDGGRKGGRFRRLASERGGRHGPEVDVDELELLADFASAHWIPKKDFEKGTADPYVLYRLAATLRLYDDLLLDEKSAPLLFHYFLYPDRATEEIGRALGYSLVFVDRHLFGRGGTASPYAAFLEFIQTKTKGREFLRGLFEEEKQRFFREILETAVHSPDFTDADRRALGRRMGHLLESQSLSAADREKLTTFKVFLGLETPFAPESPKRRTFEETGKILSVSRKGVMKRIYGYVEKGAFDLLRDAGFGPDEGAAFRNALRSGEWKGADWEVLRDKIDRFLKNPLRSEGEKRKALTLKVYLKVASYAPPKESKQKIYQETAEILSKDHSLLTTPIAVKRRIGGSFQKGALDLLGAWFVVDRENLYEPFYERYIEETRRRLFRKKVEREEGEEDRLLPRQRGDLKGSWVSFRDRLRMGTSEPLDARTLDVIGHRLDGKTAGEIAPLVRLSEGSVRQITRERPDPPVPGALDLVEKRIQEDQFPFASSERFWRNRFLAGKRMRWERVPLEVIAAWVERLSRQTGKTWEQLTANTDWKRVEVKFPDEKRRRSLYSLLHHFYDLQKKERDPEKKGLPTTLYIVKLLHEHFHRLQQKETGPEERNLPLSSYMAKALAHHLPKGKKRAQAHAEDGAGKSYLLPSRMPIRIHTQKPLLYP